MILINKIRCRKCGDVIESQSVHDFKWCGCGACAVDGGREYLRRLGNSEDYEELSETNERDDSITMFVDGEWKDIKVKRPEPQKVYELYSEKYDVHGRIEDYGFVIKLKFEYKGRAYEIGIHRPLDGELADKGLGILEEGLGRLSVEPMKATLHYWYIESEYGTVHAHGNVTGHRKLEDSQFINTSAVVNTEFVLATEEMIITTVNTEFHCPIKYCSFKKQDDYPDLIENYDKLKAKYIGKIDFPEIEQGKVLLVLSDFDEYYFHSLCAKDENGNIKEYTAFPNVGMFQDSYLIQTDDDTIDIRYYPHYKNIEFYTALYVDPETCETHKLPLYAENIGSSTLHIKKGSSIYRLDPGERKELVKENAETDPPGNLPDGDLYPAGT